MGMQYRLLIEEKLLSGSETDEVFINTNVIS